MPCSTLDSTQSAELPWYTVANLLVEHLPITRVQIPPKTAHFSLKITGCVRLSSNQRLDS